MAKTAATKLIDNLPNLNAAIANMTKKAAFVGVPSETTNIRDGFNEGAINNASLAYIHQNGSPAKNIPARPFMTIGMDAAKKPVTEQLKKAAKKNLDIKNKGGIADLTVGLKLAGQVAENKIKAAINSSIAPQLSEATLRARARRGRKGAIAELASRAAGNEPSTTNARTLVDTGALRNSIKYVIRDDK